MYRPALLVLLAALALAPAGLAFAKTKHRVYVVKEGDTPALVAKKFDITSEELFRFNNLKPDGPFRAGDKLEIPFPGEVTGSKYVVKAGDSVARVADFHGCSQDDLRAANGMKPADTIRPGQELVIPYSLRGGAFKGYVVREGDTLATIAAKHHVSVAALARANKLSKDAALEIGRTLVIPDEEEPEKGGTYKPGKIDKLVTSGEKVPNGVLHTVQPGQSIWTIARAYNVGGERIAKANDRSVKDPLSVGDKILVPGAREVVPVRVKGYAIQPIHFVSVWNDEHATLRLLTASGKINQASRKALSELAGPKHKTKRIKLFHPRLLHLIQRVAERYPGSTIEVISGYRPMEKGRESKHSQGRAIDFRVRGKSNSELYDFIKELPRVGAGYYPNSVFVHLDARDETTLWTDYSAPGERSRYRPPAAYKPDPGQAATDAAPAAPEAPPETQE